jgi:hypothetical protein
MPRARRGASTLVAVAPIVLAGLFVATASAALMTSHADPAGDGNAAPDITAVAVDDSDPARLRIRVHIGNLVVLPPRSQITVHFDLDRNPATGGAGDELAVRLTDTGVVEVLKWNGARLLSASTDGTSMRFAAGVFELELDRALLGESTSFALLATSGRTQEIGGLAVVTSTDFAPHAGRSVYSLPGAKSFPDPTGDQDEAPDITKISVSDTKAEMIVARITLANHRARLPADKIVAIDFDLAGRPPSADDVLMTYESGLDRPKVERERGGVFSRSRLLNRSTGSFANGILTLRMPRNELDGASSFGFGAIGLDLVGPDEGEGDEFEGDLEAQDTAPDLSEVLPTHRLVNPGTLKLRAERMAATPVRPRANGRFVWGVVVRRLDTYQTLRKGSVTCSASVSGRPIRVAGRFLRGRAQCDALVPRGTRSRVLRGAITVRSAGSSVRAAISAVIE